MYNSLIRCHIEYGVLAYAGGNSFFQSLLPLRSILWCHGSVNIAATITDVDHFVINSLVGSIELKTLYVNRIPELEAVPWTPFVKLVNSPFKAVKQR